jgi:hypothetical protein
MFNYEKTNIYKSNLIFREGGNLLFYANGRKDSPTLIRNTEEFIEGRRSIKNNLIIEFDSTPTLYGISQGYLRNREWTNLLGQFEILYLLDTETSQLTGELSEIVLYEVTYNEQNIVINTYCYHFLNNCQCHIDIKNKIKGKTVFVNDPRGDSKYFEGVKFIDVAPVIHVHPKKILEYKCFCDVVQIFNILDSFKSVDKDLSKRGVYYNVENNCIACKQRTINFLSNIFENFTKVTEKDEPEEISVLFFITHKFAFRDGEHYQEEKKRFLKIKEISEQIDSDSIMRKMGALKKSVNTFYTVEEIMYLTNDGPRTKYILKIEESKNKMKLYFDIEDKNKDESNDWLRSLKLGIPVVSSQVSFTRSVTTDDFEQKKGNMAFDINTAFAEMNLRKNINNARNPSKTVTASSVISFINEKRQSESFHMKESDNISSDGTFNHTILVGDKKYLGRGTNKKEAKKKAYTSLVEDLGYTVTGL